MSEENFSNTLIALAVGAGAIAVGFASILSGTWEYPYVRAVALLGTMNFFGAAVTWSMAAQALKAHASGPVLIGAWALFIGGSLVAALGVLNTVSLVSCGSQNPFCDVTLSNATPEQLKEIRDQFRGLFASPIK